MPAASASNTADKKSNKKQTEMVANKMLRRVFELANPWQLLFAAK
jgi:hypothetical protein